MLRGLCSTACPVRVVGLQLGMLPGIIAVSGRCMRNQPKAPRVQFTGPQWVSKTVKATMTELN